MEDYVHLFQVWLSLAVDRVQNRPRQNRHPVGGDGSCGEDLSTLWR